MSDVFELKQLYSAISKHSNYQSLPTKVSSLISEDELEIHSRYERERLNFILANIRVQAASILDIGGNSGYFTFELHESGAAQVHYYEGNKIHAEFVRLAADLLNIENIEITNGYFPFESIDLGRRYNVVLLLNVLHHVGDDFGNKYLSIQEAKRLIIEYLNRLSEISDLMVFQLGYNWKGNREWCLFENGTKREMIDYVRNGVKGYWAIDRIGIAGTYGGKIIYQNVNDYNIARNDALGEFLNRPIFIMRSIRNCR